MTRKPGRPPLPRDGTTIRRLPVHATDDEYNALMAALHVDTRERFFQIDGAVTDYNIHVDEIAAEHDELLDVCRELLGPMIVWSQYWASTYNRGKLSPAHEEIIQRASVVIARNTPQEDSNEPI